MSETTALVPMTEDHFAEFLAGAIPSFAQDKVTTGQWTEEEALERSRATYAGLLPQGLATPRHHLYAMRDGSGATVGMIWICVQQQGREQVAFVYEVAVDEVHRRKGHARRAFLALEEVVRSLGLTGIALHVFGHNTAARTLYESLGYAVTNVNMYKELG